MRIGFVSRGGLLKAAEAEQAEVLLCGFCGDEVSYEKELKGETDYFERVARLSKTLQNVVVCGCVTNARGHKRKSALVAENGTLLGVTDMLNVVDGECASGAALGVYSTKAGRLGVVVAEDLNFPDIIKSLAMCGSDFIVCPYGKSDGVQSALIRAHAYCFGVPIYFCGEGYAMIADPSGNIAFASPENPVYTEFKNSKEYHLVETRQRGFSKSSVTTLG